MKLSALPLIALALALAACSSVHVASDYDPKANFARLHVYSWMSRPKSESPIVENTLVTNRIRNAIDRELAAKGFRRADAGASDFVVDFATATRDRVDVRTWPSWCWGHSGCGFGWSHGGWNDRVEVFEYVQGTLMVGVLDPTTNELLWRGTATQVLDEKSGSESRVDEAVKALLADFPPQAK